LVQLGERLCTTPEQFKAWSQNLGHERVMTTLTSYGNVTPQRQAEVLRGLGEAPNCAGVDAMFLARVAMAVQQISGNGIG
jgi:hypothetical protein